MRDTNYDGIGSIAAAEIEPLLWTNQGNVLEAIVRIVIKVCAGKPKCDPLAELTLREMHRAGLLFLVSSAGEYRDKNVHFGHGKHTPPDHTEVPARMNEFFLDLAKDWYTRTPIQNAAFALWKVNWIHPFLNGNGRTSRSFAYACLCLGFNMWLPGRPTILEMLNERENHDEYGVLLQATDRTLEAGSLDLEPMTQFLERLLIIQLEAIEENPLGGGI